MHCWQVLEDLFQIQQNSFHLINQPNICSRTVVDSSRAPSTCLIRLINTQNRALLLFYDRYNARKSQFGKNPPK
jgi:hypothetical protein